MHHVHPVAAEDACLDCSGTGDAGPLYSDTIGLPYRLACRRCMGTGKRGTRHRLADTLLNGLGLLLFGLLLVAAYVVTP